MNRLLVFVACAGLFGCHDIADNSGGDAMPAVGDGGHLDQNIGGDIAGVDLRTPFNFDLDGCVASSKETQVLPLDIMLALDTSYSMDFDGKWPAVKTALKSFVNSPKASGITLGLQYFPLRKQCRVDDYATPAIALSALPGAAPTFTASLDAQNMNGGTPMVPMLDGLYKYLKDYQAANPNRKVVLVVATDGIPDDQCVAPSYDGGLGNSLSNAVTLAAKAQTESPSLQTFVIGVGTELTALNQVAVGGGTNSAFIVDTAGDTQTAFFQALDTIRQASLACEFDIPKPDDGKSIVYDQVNVKFTTSDGTDYFGNVTDIGSCDSAGANGWYYDNNDMPTRVRLCPAACDKVRLTQNSRIDIVFGCATIIP